MHIAKICFAVALHVGLTISSGFAQEVISPEMDWGAKERITVTCPVVQAKAIQYFADHHIRLTESADSKGKSLELYFTKQALTSSGAPLILDRFSIRRYTQHRHLSPMKSYTDFRGTGHLLLRQESSTSCLATMNFEFSAFEYVWALAAIDDGYRSTFISNDSLERSYLQALSQLFTP